MCVQLKSLLCSLWVFPLFFFISPFSFLILSFLILIPSLPQIFGNIWAICRDPVLFPNPDAFDPERYMDLDAKGVDAKMQRRMDPREYVFGFGRRYVVFIILILIIPSSSQLLN